MIVFGQGLGATSDWLMSPSSKFEISQFCHVISERMVVMPMVGLDPAVFTVLNIHYFEVKK